MIPTVTVDQMREVDRLMMEEMEISLLQMMENAGRTLAAQARHLLERRSSSDDQEHQAACGTLGRRMSSCRLLTTAMRRRSKRFLRRPR